MMANSSIRSMNLLYSTIPELIKLLAGTLLQKNFIERAHRMRTYKSAFLYNDVTGGKRACILRNISETGALLQIEDFSSLPTEFTVGVELDAYEVVAKWIWRKDVRLGVEFQGPLEQLKATRMQVVNPLDAPIQMIDVDKNSIQNQLAENPSQLLEQSTGREQQANLRRLKHRRSQGFGKR